MSTTCFHEWERGGVRFAHLWRRNGPHWSRGEDPLVVPAHCTIVFDTVKWQLRNPAFLTLHIMWVIKVSFLPDIEEQTEDARVAYTQVARAAQ